MGDALVETAFYQLKSRFYNGLGDVVLRGVRAAAYCVLAEEVGGVVAERPGKQTTEVKADTGADNVIHLARLGVAGIADLHCRFKYLGRYAAVVFRSHCFKHGGAFVDLGAGDVDGVHGVGMTDVGHVVFLIGGIFGLRNDAVIEFDAVFVVSVVFTGDYENTVGYHKCALFKEDVAYLNAVGLINAVGFKELMDLGYHVYLALAREVGRDDKLAAFVLAYRDRACGSLECVDVHIVNDISELVVAALLAVAAVLVNVLDHFCHFVKCPFVALYKVVGGLFYVVGLKEILVVECPYHHPEKVGGDVSGAEIELVVDGAFVHKSLGHHGFSTLKYWVSRRLAVYP